jgi:glycosyltransferase involved in cell wall biosynthesis
MVDWRLVDMTPRAGEPKEAAMVSVVITTRNEEANIGNCLESVKKQLYPDERIEIIVVDNNSKDKTVDIAARFTHNIYNFGPERSAQRNLGVNKSSGEFILYLDADMILSESVIPECVEKCKDEKIAALYVPEKITGSGFWIKVRNFERSFYNATPVDCVRFVRRDKFLKVLGFDESLTGPEDWDFDRRIKNEGPVEIIESPIYHNEGKFNLNKYVKKKAYYGVSFKSYINKWGSSDPIVRKQLGLGYRYFGVFIENRKWLRLVRHPLLTAGLYWLRFLVGLSYLVNCKLCSNN